MNEAHDKEAGLTGKEKVADGKKRVGFESVHIVGE